MIRMIYHMLPMWVWEVLVLIGYIGSYMLMVAIGLYFAEMKNVRISWTLRDTGTDIIRSGSRRSNRGG